MTYFINNKYHNSVPGWIFLKFYIHFFARWIFWQVWWVTRVWLDTKIL